MPTATHFLAVSQEDIMDHLIDYFATRQGRPRSYFEPDTDIKKRFGYSDTAWANVAPAISAKDWMKKISVVIDRPDMRKKTTIEALTGLIWGRVAKLIPISATTLQTTSLKLSTRRKSKRKSAAKRTRMNTRSS